MADVGEKKRRVIVPEPIEAPTFTRPIKREQPIAPVAPWLDPNKVPVTAPVRERELVRVGGN